MKTDLYLNLTYKVPIQLMQQEITIGMAEEIFRIWRYLKSKLGIPMDRDHIGICDIKNTLTPLIRLLFEKSFVRKRRDIVGTNRSE